MQVAIVTHSGPRVGLGHLRRCLTIADELAARGASVGFVLGSDPDGHATVRGRGFDTTAIPEHVISGIVPAVRAFSPNVIVADSYDLFAADLDALRAIARLVVIDDLADRQLPADLVWNGGIQATASQYATRVAPQTRLLLGTAYALLAREYRELLARPIEPTVSRVLLTVGGADPCGAMPMLYRAARRALPDATFELALGPHVAIPRELPPDSARDIAHHAPPTLAPLIARADLAVSAGGQTCYELAASGVPAVIVWNADNQEPQTRELDRRGIARSAGDARQGAATEPRVEALIAELASSVETRRAMSVAGRASLDGNGAARTAAAILELC